VALRLMKWGVIAAVVAILFTAGLSTIAIIDSMMSGVPSQRYIATHTALTPAYVQPSPLTGIYFNSDINALVVAYATATEDDATFRATVDSQMAAAGWTIAPLTNAYLCYTKGTEEIRIRVDHPTITVAWVKGHKTAAFTQIWPMLDTPPTLAPTDSSTTTTDSAAD